jgi:RES domain-containing protein
VTLWRASNHRSLDGAGGLRASGRWHTRGRPIVYCAPNPATALLEVLVHAEIDLDEVPTGFRYLEIEAPDSIPAAKIDIGTLGHVWETNIEKTRGIGDRWLYSRETVLLQVPSVIVPVTWNVLINPLHADSRRVRIARIHEHRANSRLLK